MQTNIKRRLKGMKKILVSLMVIALVCALIGTGIHAYFSDVETSTGNTFTAGTLNLIVGSVDPCTQTITVSNLKPSDTGDAGIWITRNDGSIDGKLTVAVGTITNNENGVQEPETGDTGGPGELGANLKVAFWMDADKSGGTWSSGDYYLKSDGTKESWNTGESTLPGAAYATVDSYDSKTWTDVQNVAASTDAGNFRIEYDLPSATGNNVQSDSCVFTITFTLNQQ
jgi:predicted ribosomally synthesized peptide with SipW-like signal peptide